MDWVRDLFCAVGTSPTLRAKEELLGVRTYRELRFKFHEISLDTFCLTGKEEYPVIANVDVRMLLPLSTTHYVYWCLER
jgi:hypothetical protein